MKKTTALKTLAAAAMSLLAIACAKEPTVVDGNGETTEVSFNVDMPGASVATKGISDASSVNELICQLFIEDGSGYKLIQTYNVPVAEKKASLKMTLVRKQHYYLAFWAQTKGTGYYNTDDLRKVTINYDAVKANDPQMDAFWKSVELNLPAIKDSELSKKTKVTLLRAVAQVNFGSEALNREDALTVSESSISMTGVPNTFNALFDRDDSYTGSVDVTYKTNATITEEKLSVAGKDYDYLATAYVFASRIGNLTKTSAKFMLTNGKSVSVELDNVPIKRNTRTNILGNLLTVDTEWNVTIDSEFKGGDINYDAVSANLAAGETVTLAENYEVDASNLRGINIPSGVESTLNLGGYRFANENGTTEAKAALVVKGKLTINGDGEVYCEGNTEAEKSNNAILVQEGGHLIINGGSYSVGKDAAGKSNATIYVENVGKPGKVEIYGGTFTNEAGSNGHGFVLNQDDELKGQNCIVVYGGTFIGFNPADNEADGENTNYVAEGYYSTKVSTDPATGISTYVVTKDGVTPVAGQEQLAEVINGLKDAADGSNVSIQLPAGEFTTYDNASLKGKDVTVSYVGAGAGKTTFAVGTDNHVAGAANGDYSLDGVTKASFKNMTIKVDNDDYRGYIRVKELEFENCVFENRISYWGTGKVSFKNCTFNQTNEDYNLWTYSGSEFIFDGCTFNCAGKCINAYKEQHDAYKMTFKDCIFISSKTNKSVVELKSNGGVKYELHFDGKNNVRGFASSKVTGYTQFNSNDGETDSIVSFGTKTVWKNGAKVE